MQHLSVFLIFKSNLLLDKVYLLDAAFSMATLDLISRMRKCVDWFHLCVDWFHVVAILITFLKSISQFQYQP